MYEEMKKFDIVRAAVARQYPDASNDIVLAVSAGIFSSCASRGIEFIPDVEERIEEAAS